LSEDVTKIDPPKLFGVHVLYTITGGRAVYDADAVAEAH
jgi:hypothetical protein